MSITRLIPFFCVVFFVFTCVLSMRHLGMTYDEFHNFGYSQRVLQNKSARIDLSDQSRMPFNVINVLFAKAVTHFFIVEDLVKVGRYATIIAGMVLLFYVFRWSYELYGIIPALFSLFLISFDPNIIAHSRLVTTDIYAAMMMTVSLYYFWKFFKYGGWTRGFVSAMTIGISQIAKYTCLAFYPLCFLMGAGKYLWLCFRLNEKRDYKGIRNLTLKYLAYGVMYVAMGILMINVAFGFLRTGTLLKDYKFDGNVCRSVQSVAFLEKVPVPVPYAYVKGLDMLDLSTSKGYTYGNIYLLGHLKDKAKGDIKGFRGYYFVAYLFKTPLASQLIILLAAFHYWRNRDRYHFWEDEVFLIVPLLCFGIYFNFFFNMQVGIRYILFCYPLLYVFAGSLFIDWYKFKTSAKAIFLALLVYLALSTISYAPHFISYFNELVWDRKMGYKVLADSNLDWGGEKWYADQYIKKHPEIIYEPSKPTTGHIMVGANQLTGVVWNPEKFKWLRENYEPVDQVAYAFLIFDVIRRKNNIIYQKR